MYLKAAGCFIWTLAIVLLAAVVARADPVRGEAEAQEMVRALLASRTPPLYAGAVRQVGQSYEVEVVTPAGSLADRWLVDGSSDRIRSLYGRMLMSFDGGWGTTHESMGNVGGNAGSGDAMGGGGPRSGGA